MSKLRVGVIYSRDEISEAMKESAYYMKCKREIRENLRKAFLSKGTDPTEEMLDDSEKMLPENMHMLTVRFHGITSWLGQDKYYVHDCIFVGGDEGAMRPQWKCSLAFPLGPGDSGHYVILEDVEVKTLFVKDGGPQFILELVDAARADQVVTIMNRQSTGLYVVK